MISSNRDLPNALADWAALVERLRSRQLAIFLDYDGTLVPIAQRPELARLGADQRDQLRQLGQVWPTFVLSGRGREDVDRMLGVDAIRCVGAHGLDLGAEIPPELAALSEITPLIDAAAAELSALAADIPNLLIEHKTVVLSVHYRLVPASMVRRIEEAVDRIAAREPALKKTTGKMVYELRPVLDWNKGSALRWLLSMFPASKQVIPVFIGDDTTDEDAFEAVVGRGIGIVVDAQRPTAAHYAVRDVAEVYDLLERIRGLAAS